MAQKKLDAAQLVAKEGVALAVEAKRRRKAELAAEFKIIQAREMEIVNSKVDEAIVRAVDLGVPKSHLTTYEVIGSVNPHVVNNAIARVRDGKEQAAEVEVTRFTWLDEAKGIVQVSYRNFPTTSKDPAYPEVLRGKVRRIASGYGWAIVEDEGDTTTEFGVIPGALTWELERTSDHDNIGIMLTEWESHV